MKIIYAFLMGFFCILLMSGGNIANADDNYWEQIEKQKNVTITTENGVRTAHFSGGVTISESGLSMDNSGLGAVQCAWEFYTELSAMLDVCGFDKEKIVQKKLDLALDEIDAFIVKNSILPITLKEIQDKRLELRQHASDQIKVSVDEGRSTCKEKWVEKTYEKFKKNDDGEFGAGIKKMLSVPRPPVMNPCL